MRFINKRIFYSIFILIIYLFNLSFTFAIDEPNINSQSGILVDTKSGQVLYEKNADEKLYPASTTKIMTAILVLEKCKNLDDIVTASNYAVMSIEAGSSSIYLSAGEEMSVKNLLYALMLPSANDAANVLAEYIGGTIDYFVKLMNDKAKDIGCTNTRFANPHGLHNEDHYTTARDLAKISRYAVTFDKSDILREITSTKLYTFSKTNKLDKVRTERNTNALLFPANQSLTSKSYFFEGCYGLKTGFTNEAGQNQVSSAIKNNIDLLCVNLKGNQASDRSDDAIKLLNYGFDNFTKQNLLNDEYSDTIKIPNEKDMLLNVTVKDNISFLSNLNDNKDTKNIASDLFDIETIVFNDLKLPIVKEQIVGKLVYTSKNSISPKTYEMNLVSMDDINLPFSRTDNFKYILIGILGVLLLFILFVVRRRIKSHKKRMRRKKMKERYQYRTNIK